MSWNDLYQMSAGMTETEIRFEKAKRLVGMFLGPALFVLFGWFWPPLPHVNAQGMIAFGICMLAVTWWITEAVPVPVTSIVVMPLSVITGLFPYTKAFGYWADRKSTV